MCQKSQERNYNKSQKHRLAENKKPSATPICKRKLTTCWKAKKQAKTTGQTQPAKTTKNEQQ
jgi:hypothetical protein